MLCYSGCVCHVYTNHDSTFKWAMATIPPPPLIHVPVYKLANNRG